MVYLLKMVDLSMAMLNTYIYICVCVYMVCTRSHFTDVVACLDQASECSQPRPHIVHGSMFGGMLKMTALASRF